MSRTTEFLSAAEAGDLEVVRSLLSEARSDIDVNSVNQWGNTALIEAANHGDTEIVRLLLTNGARLDSASQGGSTALMCAALKGHREIVSLLLKAGADVSRTDLDGATALSLAKLRGHDEITTLLSRSPAPALRLEVPVKSEKDRSRTIMALSGLAVLVVIVLIIVVTSVGRRQSQTAVALFGSPEFDAYASNVIIDNIEKKTGVRLNNRYARILCTLQNTGDQVLSGVHLKAAIIGTGGQLIREKIFTPVPNVRDTLGPNQTMNIDVSVEPVPDPSEIMDMTIELNGLKLK